MNPTYKNPTERLKKNIKKTETPSPPTFFFFSHGQILLPSLFSPATPSEKPSTPSPMFFPSSLPIPSCSSSSSGESASLSSAVVIVCKNEEHKEAIKKSIHEPTGNELQLLSTTTSNMVAKTIKYSDVVSIHLSNPPPSFKSGSSPYAINEGKSYMLKSIKEYHKGFQAIMDEAKQTMYYQVHYIPVDRPPNLPVPEVRQDVRGNGPSNPVIVSKLRRDPKTRKFSPNPRVASALEWEAEGNGGDRRGGGGGGGRDVDRVKGTLLLNAVMESMKRSDLLAYEVFTGTFCEDLKFLVRENILTQKAMLDMSGDLAVGLSKVDGRVFYW